GIALGVDARLRGGYGRLVRIEELEIRVQLRIPLPGRRRACVPQLAYGEFAGAKPLRRLDQRQLVQGPSHIEKRGAEKWPEMRGAGSTAKKAYVLVRRMSRT